MFILKVGFFPTVKHVLENTMQCNAMQCNAMQCNAMQCNAMQCNAMQCNAMQCNAMQYNTIQYNTIQYNTIQYNTIQYNTIGNKQLIQPFIYTLIQSTNADMLFGVMLCSFPRPAGRYENLLPKTPLDILHIASQVERDIILLNPRPLTPQYGEID